MEIWSEVELLECVGFEGVEVGFEVRFEVGFEVRFEVRLAVDGFDKLELLRVWC